MARAEIYSGPIFDIKQRGARIFHHNYAPVSVNGINNDSILWRSWSSTITSVLRVRWVLKAIQLRFSVLVHNNDENAKF